jgi:aryl-alcohol dehydrogenase-like predicted oxidoreductase
MKYNYLGKTGVKVSEYSFGVMTFGKEADEKESEKLFNMCLDKGINFFDTANWYSKGVSEEILGRLMKPRRKDLVIASKVGLPMSDKPNDGGASRRHIMMQVEGSLKRLQTDWIDLYYIHIFDENTHLEETLRALNTLVEQGKILYIGLSNFSAWQVMKAIGITRVEKLSPIACVQPMYNLIKRQVEVEILPMAESENLGVFPYNPLGGGMLTGKYLGKDYSSGKRLSDMEMYKKRYSNEEYFEITRNFVNFAKDNGYKPAPLALAWVNAHPQITSTMMGARNTEQLSQNFEALDIDMTEDLRKKITALSIDPPSATDR